MSDGYCREEVGTKTVLDRFSKKPIEIKIPIIVGVMNFGAFSKEAKIALANVSEAAGTIEKTSEGGRLLEEREFSKFLIVRYSIGRFGITEEILENCL